MKRKVTHFRYVCRICHKVIEQPVGDRPETSPIPTCCSGKRSDTAYKGVVYADEVPE